jgi:hypothetical protein
MAYALKDKLEMFISVKERIWLSHNADVPEVKQKKTTKVL